MKIEITVHCGEGSDYRLKREDAIISVKRSRATYDIVVHSEHAQSLSHIHALVAHEVRGIITQEMLK